MKKNISRKCLATIIIFLIIGTSFVSVSANIINNDQNKSNIPNEQISGLKDIFFDLKMKVLMRLAKFPSLSVYIIENDEVTWSKGYGFYDLENKKPATDNTIYNQGFTHFLWSCFHGHIPNRKVPFQGINIILTLYY